MTLELEPTQDILAAAGRMKRPGQRIVGFSLDEPTEASLDRARRKLVAKGCDLLVYNPIATLGADEVSPVLVHRDGRLEHLAPQAKSMFARRLIKMATQ